MCGRDFQRNVGGTLAPVAEITQSRPHGHKFGLEHSRPTLFCPSSLPFGGSTVLSGNRTKPAICQRHEQSRGQKKSETESETGLEVRLSNRVPGLRVHLVVFFGSLLLALIPLSAVHWSQNDIKNSCKTVPKQNFAIDPISSLLTATGLKLLEI